MMHHCRSDLQPPAPALAVACIRISAVDTRVKSDWHALLDLRWTAIRLARETQKAHPSSRLAPRLSFWRKNGTCLVIKHLCRIRGN